MGKNGKESAVVCSSVSEMPVIIKQDEQLLQILLAKNDEIFCSFHLIESQLFKDKSFVVKLSDINLCTLLFIKGELNAKTNLFCLNLLI